MYCLWEPGVMCRPGQPPLLSIGRSFIPAQTAVFGKTAAEEATKGRLEIFATEHARSNTPPPKHGSYFFTQGTYVLPRPPPQSNSTDPLKAPQDSDGPWAPPKSTSSAPYPRRPCLPSLIPGRAGTFGRTTLPRAAFPCARGACRRRLGLMEGTF